MVGEIPETAESAGLSKAVQFHAPGLNVGEQKRRESDQSNKGDSRRRLGGGARMTGAFNLALKRHTGVRAVRQRAKCWWRGRDMKVGQEEGSTGLSPIFVSRRVGSRKEARAGRVRK